MKDALLRFKNSIGVYPSNLNDFVKLCGKKNIKKTSINITKEEVGPYIGDVSILGSYYVIGIRNIDEHIQHIIAYFNTSVPYIRGCEILGTMDEDTAIDINNVNEKIEQYKTDLTKRLKEYGMACSFKA